MPSNSAAKLLRTRTPLEVQDAPYPAPQPDQIVIRNRAIAVNPVDWSLQLAGTIMYRWLSYPAVLGSDVAGEVVEIGSAVTRFAVGDRVLGQAVGTDKDSDSPAEGAFQHYTVVLERLASPIPDTLSYEQASVLPLGISTAACALFQKDLLALRHPSATPLPTGETVLIWGGSTSVGANAIQLAVAAGYEVITTASPKNAASVTGLGASQVFDYGSPTVVADVIAALRGKTLAGTFAIGKGSSERCVDIVRAVDGRKFIALASTPVTFESVAGGGRVGLKLVRVLTRIGASMAALLLRCRIHGIGTKFVFGTTLKHNEVSRLIYEEFLPSALAEGRYLAVPAPLVVGHGLEAVQVALDTQRKGVGARKVVVTL
jgi:NADPH:quinone reductase-like Zn-dependent oxidoreductase